MGNSSQPIKFLTLRGQGAVWMIFTGIGTFEPSNRFKGAKNEPGVWIK